MADATAMARNGKIPPLNDKLTVLCKLRGSIYFEKILTASSAYLDNLHGPSTLALPAWFVQEHGDKFRKHVVLRTELSTKPWSVTLTVFHKSPSVRQVKFAGGWKTFATFHSLVVGDSVIFALTAISEFEVYMFPGNRNPRKLPYQVTLKKRSDDSGLPLKKLKPFTKIEPMSAEDTVQLNETTIGDQQRAQVSPTSLRYSDDIKSRIVTDPTPHDEELIKAPGASDGRQHPGGEPYIFRGPTIRKKLNELLAQKKATFESAYGSDPKPLQNEDVHLPDPVSKPTAMDSSSRDHHGSNNGRDDELMVQSDISEDVPPLDETLGLTLPKMPVNFPLSAGFLKQLTASNFDRREDARTACMEIPVVFWRTYGSRLRSVVKLQGIREESQVRTAACLPILQGDQTWRLYLRAGWRDFADANGLEVGQVLEFTLTADSFFVVRSAIS